ncbi:MAG TPA: site-specific DNA-methyltransferase [Solirubrobacterales bacterium]|nr:site-specific DNA-methyltransferase [Solirubrobacterales bacterium]
MLSGYRGRFKLIYIDPPYNTGESYVYEDRYSVPEPEYLLDTGQVDEQGQATSGRVENGGRKHAPWLTMMLPRLAVARYLLSRDGAIVVSIDDNEAHHLRVLLDGLLGERNRLGTFIWEGGRKNDAKFVSEGHDYMFCYARDKAYLEEMGVRFRVAKPGAAEILAEVERLREIHGEDNDAIEAGLAEWYGSLPKGHTVREIDYYRYVDHRGVFYLGDISSPNTRTNLIYDYKGYSPPEKGWRYERETMERLDSEERVWFPDSKDKRLQIKRYLHESDGDVPGSVFYRDRRGASKSLDALLGEDVFDNPKDVGVLRRLVEAIATDEGDLVLDFFAGSGTTAEAVWRQEKADGIGRRWVLVQAPEAVPPESAASKAGFESVYEIARRRLSLVADALEKETDGEAGDFGLRAFECAESNLVIHPPIVNDGDLSGEEYVQQSIERTKEPAVKPGVDHDALVWEILLKGTKLDLSARVHLHETRGERIYELRAGDGRELDGRVFVFPGERMTISLADELGLVSGDRFFCRSDALDDSASVTIGQRCRLVFVERVPGAV